MKAFVFFWFTITIPSYLLWKNLYVLNFFDWSVIFVFWYSNRTKFGPSWLRCDASLWKSWNCRYCSRSKFMLRVCLWDVLVCLYFGSSIVWFWHFQISIGIFCLEGILADWKIDLMASLLLSSAIEMWMNLQAQLFFFIGTFICWLSMKF